MKSAWSLVVVLLALPLVAACPPRPPSTVPDHEAPRITLQIGAHSFNSDEGTEAPPDACAKVRAFPAALSVAAADRGGGGIARVTVSVFPGAISDVSVAPSTADTSLSLDRSSHVLTITPRPPAASVQPNLLATFKVASQSGVVVSATDTSGNRSALFQVDVRPAGDVVICRGESTSP